MKPPREQVLDYLRKVDQATLLEINCGITHKYYANGSKHLGAVLSRLVKRGLVERVKKGVFKLADQPVVKPNNSRFKYVNQTNLF